MNLQRVAWIALIYFFARSIRVAVSQLSNLWPLLVVFFTAGAELRGLILLGVAIVVPTFLLVFTVLSWWFFRYALSEHSLHVREGIIWRKQLTLDFARIQQAECDSQALRLGGATVRRCDNAHPVHGRRSPLTDSA